jgi:phosphohistidine phosphatase
VYCSTAERARETWNLVVPELNAVPEVALHADVYDADAGDLIEIVRRAPERAQVLVLVGHNPAMEDAAQALTGSGDLQALRTLRQKYPTAALAEITFQADAWPEVAAGTGRLERFVRPKDLD